MFTALEMLQVCSTERCTAQRHKTASIAWRAGGSGQGADTFPRGVSPRPRPAIAAAEAITGTSLSEGNMQQVAEAVLADARPMTRNAYTRDRARGMVVRSSKRHGRRDVSPCLGGGTRDTLSCAGATRVWRATALCHVERRQVPVTRHILGDMRAQT